MPNVLGERIKNLRQEIGLTQKELADKLNVSNTTLSQYETGQRIPSDEIKIKIANYFQVTIDYLLGKSEYRGEDNNGPLTKEQGDLIVQQALSGAGLLEPDGSLSERGGKIISEFLANNADILKKLMQDNK